jgi:type II secretory pathway pseudopilin PulG
MKKALPAFTLIELVVVVAIVGFIVSIILAGLTSAQLDARDKRRIADVRQLENALQLYYTRYNTYPTEVSGANGNVSTNTIFQTVMAPFLSGFPSDPTGPGNATYYYYYDGKHNCGGKEYAVIFARQMDKAANVNYDIFLNTTCEGILDGEGRGGGAESYNIILGSSGG